MQPRAMILASAVGLLLASGAEAACAFKNEVPPKSLSADFQAWKSVTSAMAECGTVQAELDQEFQTKQPAAFVANPALHHIGGVANEMVPLLNAGTIRPLDDLVAKHDQQLTSNQLIKIDGKIMAVAMMVNARHLMVRKDILDQLQIPVPSSYDEVVAAAAKIKAANLVDYPLGGTFKAGWNLGQEFVNMYLGHGGTFFGDGNVPAINNEAGVKALETLKALAADMDPEFLTHDSTALLQLLP